MIVPKYLFLGFRLSRGFTKRWRYSGGPDLSCRSVAINIIFIILSFCPYCVSSCHFGDGVQFPAETPPHVRTYGGVSAMARATHSQQCNKHKPKHPLPCSNPHPLSVRTRPRGPSDQTTSLFKCCGHGLFHYPHEVFTTAGR